MGNTATSCAKPSTDKPSLVYWAVHGRSDFCQAMLVAGDIEYDLDTETANAWPAGKDAAPFGQIPYINHGSLTIAQGGALNRYCARLAGLYPEGPVEASVCDMYMEEMMDIFGGIFKAKNAPDKEAKIAAWKSIEEEHLPKHFALLEKNIVKSGKPFLGGDKYNAADVAFFAVTNLYAKAGLDVDKILSEVAPTMLKALTETRSGNLRNFPDRGLYFSSNPDDDAF